MLNDTSKIGCYLFLTDLRDLKQVQSINISQYEENHNIDALPSARLVIILVVFLVLLGINILLVTGLMKTNRKLTTSHKLYILLSCSDISSILLLLFLYLHEKSNTLFKICMRKAIGFACYSFLLRSSNGVLLVISILRNVSIRKPLVVHHIKPKTVYLAVGIYCILPLLYSIFSIVAHFPNLSNSQTLGAYYLTRAAILIVEMILVGYFNISSKRTLGLKRNELLRNSKNNNNRNYLRHQNAVAILIALTVLYSACNLPLVGYYLVYGFSVINFASHTELFFQIRYYGSFSIFHAPSTLCTGLNALVYVLNSPEIKKFFYQLICKCKTTQPIMGTSEIYRGRSHNTKLMEITS